ncbi:MAG: sugar ABC transporter permease [Microbacterium sp.]
MSTDARDDLSRGAAGADRAPAGIGLTTKRRPSATASERRLGFLLLSPALVLIILVAVVPIGLAVYYSLFSTSYLTVRDFVGFKNFADLFSSPRFHNALIVSLKYVIGSLALALLIALPLAASLTGAGRATSVLRAIVFLPWVISQVVTALLWVWMLNPSFGPISAMLAAFGIPPLEMLSSPGTAIVAIVIANVWATYPLATVLLLAAMQSVPDELYDAAAVDGCGPWRGFLHVTIPGIRSALAMTAINLTVYYFNMVTLIYTMTGGGPLRSTETIALNIYLEAFVNNRLSTASAYGVIALLLNIVFAVSYIRVLRGVAEEGAK